MLSYLDNSASTKVDPKVVEAMLPFFTEKYGNPSSLHSFGREAREAVEKSREKIAALIGAKPNEIIFTSGGTESDNLALRGVNAKAIFTSNIEHPAILETCASLARNGAKANYLKIEKNGILDAEKAISAINAAGKETLVSIMMANNEIGTIQPIAEISKGIHESVILHTDAVQAVGKIPIDVNKLGVDLLSLASHKFHGPKGVGALFIRDGIKLSAVQTGGGHERGLRSGTENVPGIVGMGVAAEIAKKNLDDDMRKMSGMRDKLIDGLSRLEETYLNGDRMKRLPNNVNVRFVGIEGESLIMKLDGEGIAASTGSACSSKKLQASHVLLALGIPEWQAHGSLRMTLSRFTTEKEIEYALEKTPQVVSLLREMSPVWRKMKSGEKISNVKGEPHVH